MLCEYALGLVPDVVLLKWFANVFLAKPVYLRPSWFRTKTAPPSGQNTTSVKQLRTFVEKFHE